MSGAQNSLIEQLALHLQRPVPEDVCARARWHLLDWLGCVAGARRSEAAQRVSGSGLTRATWLGNWLEMDDVHRAAILHPGPVIWPAVLAAGSGSLHDALAAAVRGYEAAISIGCMLDAHHYAYWHNTTTAGVFGAAAAAASSLQAGTPQLTSALALAGSVSGGLWQMRHEAVLAKQWHVAHAVTTGLAAAQHACAGITGPRFILEGPQGLLAATCRHPRPLVLSAAWRIGEVSFKPWGACRHTHPAITAALELRAAGGLEAPILVRTYRDALTFCDRPEPRTVLEARFSLQHAIAVVATRGEPTLADFEPAAIAELADRRAHVSVEEAPELTAAYPGHFGAEVRAGGRAVTCHDAAGDPERPLEEAALIGKARALMHWGGLDTGEADAAVEAALQGTTIETVTALLERWL